MKIKNYNKLSEKAKTFLQVICSNYRDNFNITARFSCRAQYGADKFRDEIEKYMSELKKYKFILDYYITEGFGENDKIDFSVEVNVNMSVEIMAEIAINSQSVYIPN